MTRREAIGAVVGAVVGAAGLPAVAADSPGGESFPVSPPARAGLRLVERWTGAGWARCRMAALRAGDVFRLEGDRTAGRRPAWLFHNVFRAAADPKPVPEDPDGGWSIAAVEATPDPSAG